MPETTPATGFRLDDFTPADADGVNRVALAAFRQYRHDYADWPRFSGLVGDMASLAKSAELVVARVGDRVAGAVAYVGPGRGKAPFFATEWAVLRMLVVDPEFRGRGIGRALSRECIRRAARDEAPLIALHTSRIMTAALALYGRMGFRFLREAPEICGVPYGIHVLSLEAGAGAEEEPK